MKLQFSLATLLICMTVLAVVCGLAVSITSVRMLATVPSIGESPSSYDSFGNGWIDAPYPERPSVSQVALRVAIWGPLSIVAMLAVLWIARRLRTD